MLLVYKERQRNGSSKAKLLDEMSYLLSQK